MGDVTRHQGLVLIVMATLFCVTQTQIKEASAELLERLQTLSTPPPSVDRENVTMKTLEVADASVGDPSTPVRASQTSSISVPSSRGPETAEEEKSYRLPNTLHPRHYRLRLQPILYGNFSVLGRVEVDLEVLQETKNVVFNLVEITVGEDSVKVTSKGQNESLPIVSQEYDPLRQQYTVQLAKTLLPGTRAHLALDFVGHLNDKLVGFYRSSYTRIDGSKTWVAATQFSPADARRAFPCWDEPLFKATFDVTLGRPSNLTTLSNMPLINTSPLPVSDSQSPWVWDHFNTTLLMSTYLVAFFVCDYEYLQSTELNHTDLKVWTRPTFLHQAKYALEITPPILTFFEDYFGIKYPMPKIDMISVPDFKFSAMENWGLITFRESLLLYDPEFSSAKEKYSSTGLFAHEIAHQWFGNLVTPAWWSDLWLKEGFASYLAHVAMHQVQPTWAALEIFVISYQHSAFRVDALLSSHPINMVVNNTNQISEIFDFISYRKGAALIRMMEGFLSARTFRYGLQDYLNKLAYGNAEQKDLWDSLTAVAHVDGTLPDNLSVKEVMDTWTLQEGFPVVRVTRSKGGNTAVLTQERFLLEKANGSATGEPMSWWIPITWTTKNSTEVSRKRVRLWMEKSQFQTEVTGLPSYKNTRNGDQGRDNATKEVVDDSWVLFNVEGAGFYRVNYDVNNWHLLSRQLHRDPHALDVISRAQLIDDAFSIARAGDLAYKEVLTLISYLGSETKYVPWSAATTNLDFILLRFMHTQDYGALKDFLLSLLSPLYDRVGFDDNEGDDYLTLSLRRLAVGWACSMGHEPCLDTAHRLFRLWISPNSSSPIAASRKKTVVCTALKSGSERDWDATWQKYLDSDVSSEKSQLLSALACPRSTWMLKRYLTEAFSGRGNIRKQNARNVFINVAKNPVGGGVAWAFLRDSWEDIVASLGEGSQHLKALFNAMRSYFNTRHDLKELEEFQERYDKKLFSAERAVSQAIEVTRANVAWMEKNYDPMVTWLRDHGFSAQLAGV